MHRRPGDIGRLSSVVSDTVIGRAVRTSRALCAARRLLRALGFRVRSLWRLADTVPASGSRVMGEPSGKNRSTATRRTHARATGAVPWPELSIQRDAQFKSASYPLPGRRGGGPRVSPRPAPTPVTRRSIAGRTRRRSRCGAPDEAEYLRRPHHLLVGRTHAQAAPLAPADPWARMAIGAASSTSRRDDL